MSWRFSGIARARRARHSVRLAFAFLLAIPLAMLALAPLAGQATAHPVHPTAPASGLTASPAVDLTLHYRSTLSTGVEPTLFATDAQGNLYVSNITAEQVEMYAPDDSLVRTFGNGGLGGGNGSFNTPFGIVVAGSTVFVVDYNNDRIQTFNQSTGSYISQFGSAQLNHPTGLALGSNGTLYVADFGNNRIAEFETSGTYLGSFGTMGSGAGEFYQPFGIAFDSLNGDLYVSDFGNARVEEFTVAGNYITQWGQPPFVSPAGIAVDRVGMVYVIDAYTKTVYKFDVGGSFVGDYAAPPTTPTVLGTFIHPSAIAVRSISNTPLAVYVGDEGTGTSGTGFVQRFDQVLDPQLHTYQSQFGSAGSGNGQFSNPEGAEVDSSGNLYIADTRNNRVEKFDQFGNFLLAFGTAGSGDGQFMGPSGLAISPNGGTLWVTDAGNNRVEEFDNSGTYLGQFGSFGTGNGQFYTPNAIATDGAQLYVTDSTNSRIEVFSLSGIYQSQFGTYGTDFNYLNDPSGIAVDVARQELFISDYGNNRVDVYTTGGQFVTAITSTGSGSFHSPIGVSADQRGDVYIADTYNNQIVEVDVNNTRATTFGSAGGLLGQFKTPSDVVINPTSSQLYVVDTGNNRIQRFGSPWPKHDTVGVYRPSLKAFLLRNENSTGPADITVPMPYAQDGDLPVVGDWNGDGVDTVGLYRPSTARFLLQDANVQEAKPDYTFTLGIAGDTPIAGDWNGQGADGAGIFRPSNGILYLKNSLSTGVADFNLVLGKPGDVGIAGDWNGDGQDSPGVYRPSNERFYVTNKVTDGVVYSDASAVLGISGDAPFTGDWVAQGSSGIGVFRPTNGVTYEKNSIVTGPADNNFVYGTAGDYPVAGQWVAPSVPFSAPAPHVSLGTRLGSGVATHPASGGTPLPGHTAASGQLPAALPRRSAAR